VKLLQAEYNRRAKLRPLFWVNLRLPLKKVYTRLKIVSRPKAGVQAEGNEVNVCDIFATLEKGEDVMTLVEGSPGIGKTTFCLKLAYDWANKNTATTFTFLNFDFVLLLKCRDIDGDIMEAINEQLLPEDIEEKTRKKFLDFIKDIHNQERILIILDGLDELPQKSKHHVDKLLDRRILPFCYVLATSRQEIGIEVRNKFAFDILLQIEGFTERDAFEYIRKHFQNVDPGQSSKGERLIEEIKENTLLHALRNNPLSLLLLCVIYEDYEGKLPSSRSALYQIVVRCLLRRYCAKHNLEAHKDDKVLEKKFKKDILALGKLAWKCLLTDRYGFHEEKLTELESRNNKLVARELGLLFKEESLKRLAPQHEYCFLHKTFQEYLAAAYIAHKLRRNKFRVFEHLTLDDLVEKYPQVFLFVCGILGEEASILFKQIGKKLQNSGDWDWVECSEGVATFFIQSLSESGNGEQVAATLCSFIPFPLSMEIFPFYDQSFSEINLSDSFVDVLKACQSFSDLQQPAEVIVCNASYITNNDMRIIADTLASCTQVKTFSVSTIKLTTQLVDFLFKGLSASTNLSEFTLTVSSAISLHEAVIIGKGLATSKTLTKVTFELPGNCGEGWANALETGLSANTPLTSVVLRIYGLMSNGAIQSLEKLLSNQSLTSLSLITYGDMQDVLAAAISKGLSGETILRSLDICVYGSLSCPGANFLERGLQENRSLDNLRLFVYGELPGNWQAIVGNLRLAKSSQARVSFSFHPDTCSRVGGNQVAHFRPITVESGLSPEHRLTLNLWGELSCEGAEALCDIVTRSPLSSLTLNIHGKLTDASANSIATYLKPHKTLCTLTINIWGELTIEGKTTLQGVCNNNLTFALNVHDLCADAGELCVGLDGSINNPATVKDTTENKLSITVHHDGSEEGAHILDDGLAGNTSLTSLNITVNNLEEFQEEDPFFVDEDDEDEKWEDRLGNVLDNNPSMHLLVLTVNNYSSFFRYPGYHLLNHLAVNTSLSALTLTFNNYKDQGYFAKWQVSLYRELMENESLTTLTLIVNEYSVFNDDWVHTLGDGIEQNTSLTTINLTVNICREVSEEWLPIMCKILERSESLTTVRFQVNHHCVTSGGHVYEFSKLLAKCKSLSLLDVTVTFYGMSDSTSKSTQTEIQRKETLKGYSRLENKPCLVSLV